jgi:large subunit ribosomal protein L33
LLLFGKARDFIDNKEDFVFMREIITLACEVCKRRNYTTTKEKKNNPERLQVKKYCKWCKKHTPHKETK